MSSRTVLCVIFCIFIYSCLGAATIKAPVETFVIQSGSKDTKTVHLVGDAVSTSCEFKYDTSTEATNKKSDYTPASALLVQMSKTYGCLSYIYDIFNYQVCLSDEVTQTADNGDKYSLGKYDKMLEGHSATQTYTKGTFCEAAHTDRKSVLEFTCADKVAVHSITENAVCQYRIVIGAPEVCGHPQFTASSVDKEESWVVEISETDEGAVICQAYNNGYDVISTIRFSAFSLSLTTSDYVLIKHVVREKNRKLVANSSLQKSNTHAGISIRKAQQIDYAKIVAE